MSDSNWGKHLALGLSVALACAWLWLVAWSFITPLEYDPTLYATEADSKQDREDSDARAQIWAAHAAWWQVGIGLAGLVGLTFTVIFAGNAWHEAKQANKDARERHAADNRPWISVRAKIVGAWPPEENQVDTSNASIRLEVTYKNVGKSSLSIPRTRRLTSMRQQTDLVMRKSPRLSAGWMHLDTALPASITSDFRCFQEKKRSSAASFHWECCVGGKAPESR